LILEYTSKNWQLAFLVSAIIYGLGAVCWLWIDPVTPLEKRDNPEPAPAK
jgi:MFS transporter, ACS family, glucarate transporter